MREILFRGKSIDDGKWVEGYLLKIPSTIQWGASSPWFIDVPPQDPDGIYSRFNVDEKTVGQYIGLTDDKNGKKIFEGDIVKMLFRDDICEINPIIWSSYDFRYKVKSEDGVSYSFDNTANLEVIGNIHDNPELLKGE